MNRKSSFLTILFSLLLVSGLFAQEKYEYAIVKLYESSRIIFIATTGKTTEYKLERSEMPLTALLKKVNDLVEEGWVVYNNTESVVGIGQFGIASPYMSYHLRKKKN